METAATTVTQAGRPLPSATTRNGLAARAIPSPDRSGGTAAPASRLSFQTVTPTRISSRGRLTERTLGPRNDSGRAKTPADSCPWRAGSGLPSNAHGFFDGSVRVGHPGPRHRRFQGGRPIPDARPNMAVRRIVGRVIHSVLPARMGRRRPCPSRPTPAGRKCQTMASRTSPKMVGEGDRRAAPGSPTRIRLQREAKHGPRPVSKRPFNPNRRPAGGRRGTGRVCPDSRHPRIGENENPRV